MSLRFFELLEKLGEKEDKCKLNKIFRKDFVFAKLCHVVTGQIYSTMDLTTVVNMFKYFGIRLNYGEDLYDVAQKLRGTVKKVVGYIRGRDPEVTSDKALLYLVTTLRGKSKHERYFYMRKLFLQCDRIEFKWVIKIMCSSSMIRHLVEG